MVGRRMVLRVVVSQVVLPCTPQRAWGWPWFALPLSQVGPHAHCYRALLLHCVVNDTICLVLVVACNLLPRGQSLILAGSLLCTQQTQCA